MGISCRFFVSVCVCLFFLHSTHFFLFSRNLFFWCGVVCAVVVVFLLPSLPKTERGERKFGSGAAQSGSDPFSPAVLPPLREDVLAGISHPCADQPTGKPTLTGPLALCTVFAALLKDAGGV